MILEIHNQNKTPDAQKFIKDLGKFPGSIDLIKANLEDRSSYKPDNLTIFHRTSIDLIVKGSKTQNADSDLRFLESEVKNTPFTDMTCHIILDADKKTVTITYYR